MRAARFYDRGDIRVDEINEPIVKAGQVGIDVAWCGICGTDLHEFLDGQFFVRQQNILIQLLEKYHQSLLDMKCLGL